MLKKILLTISLLVGVNQAQAGHILGGAIYWENVAQDTFVFTVEIVRDCQGGPLPSTTTISGPNGSFTANFVADIQINQNCADPCFPVRIYKTTPVALSGTIPASGWEFAYSFCCTNSSSTNITTGSGIYLAATMFPDTAGGVPQYSAEVTSPGRLGLAVPGNQTSYVGTAIGPHADSAITALVPMRASASTTVSYKAGYSFNAPLPDASENPANGPNILNSQSSVLSTSIQSIPATENRFYVALEHLFYKHGALYGKVTRFIDVSLYTPNTPPGTLSTTLNINAQSIANPTQDVQRDTVLLGDTLIFFFNASLPNDSIYFEISSNLQDSNRINALGWNNFNFLEVTNFNPGQAEPSYAQSLYQLRFLPAADNLNQALNRVDVKISSNPCTNGQSLNIPLEIYVANNSLNTQLGNMGADTLELCNPAIDTIRTSAMANSFNWVPANHVSNAGANQVLYTHNQAAWLYLQNANTQAYADSLYVIPRVGHFSLKRIGNALRVEDSIGVDSIVWKLNGSTFVLNRVQLNLTTPGAYHAVGYTRNCVFYSDTLMVTAQSFSIAENEWASFAIYPNPASAELTVSFEENGRTAFSIYNSQGQVILKKSLYSGQRMSLQSLKPGFYIIKSSLGSRPFIKK